MITVYGLKKCSTCVKAQQWLKAQGKSFTFIDYRDEPVAPAQIQEWVAQVGWAKLINKASTSWRALSDEQKLATSDEEFLALVEQYPTLIKRPILCAQGKVLLGFKPEQYQEFFA